MRLALILLNACVHPPGPLDVAPPGPPTTVAGVAVKEADLDLLRTWGETIFRQGGYGSERSVTDVMGALMGTVRIPCPTDPTGCDKPVLPFVIAGIDALDGVPKNVFEGNGGGYTSNLALSFPPGSTVHGVPIPTPVYTGLDVDAGDFLPIGIQPVEAPPEDHGLPWLIDLNTLDGGPVPASLAEKRFRVRLACAACHYTLDVDNDGTADLTSTKPGAPPKDGFTPEHGWAAGNQDLHFGWLFALSENVMLGSFVLGGWVEDTGQDAPVRFAQWIKANWGVQPDVVRNAVVKGMLTQPRNFADVSTNANFDPIQIPPLYPRQGWPYNTNGANFDATDRDNQVWTGALDFTGLIALCSDGLGKARGGGGPKGPFAVFTKSELADIWISDAPAATASPDFQQKLKDDMVGEDGLPGVLDPKQMVALKPHFVFTPQTVAQWQMAPIRAEMSELPSRLRKRGATLGPLGGRIGIPSEAPDGLFARFAEEYPDLHLPDLANEATSVMLDSLAPPPNPSPWLTPELVTYGAEVFQASGCASCHQGPFGVDHTIHPLSDDAEVQWGKTRLPSTAAWRVPDRGLPAPVYTQPERAESARQVRALVSSPYNRATGQAVLRGGPVWGLLSNQQIGYKTTSLRGVWTSAPYLHDGGVAVSLTDPNTDATLADRLARARSDTLVYGTGQILLRGEADPTAARADAALSLQALVLGSERAKVLAANEAPIWPVVGGTTLPMAQMRITGQGHPFWVEDEPGGPDVTALVAFLLAWDDCPRDSVGQTCPPYAWRAAP